MTPPRILRFGPFRLDPAAARLFRSAGPRSLVLALEDLHWSDHATLDLLAYLARRKPLARWLILGSYRPGCGILGERRLRGVKRELQAQGLCRDLPLALLPETAVAEYLARRHPDRTVPDAWVKAIHARTEGLPVCLAQLAEGLANRVLAAAGAGSTACRRSSLRGYSNSWRSSSRACRRRGKPCWKRPVPPVPPRRWKTCANGWRSCGIS